MQFTCHCWLTLLSLTDLALKDTSHSEQTTPFHGTCARLQASPAPNKSKRQLWQTHSYCWWTSFCLFNTCFWQACWKSTLLWNFCWFKQLKNAFCFKEQHKMEEQSGSAVAVCTDDLNLWAEIAVSSLNWKSCHKTQALPPFPLLQKDARSAASEGDDCYCSSTSLLFPDAGEQNSPPQGQLVITAQKGTEPSQLREQPSTEHHLQQVLLSLAMLNGSETLLFTPQLI